MSDTLKALQELVKALEAGSYDPVFLAKGPLQVENMFNVPTGDSTDGPIKIHTDRYDVCECGAEKCGSSIHSDYCPLYECPDEEGD